MTTMPRREFIRLVSIALAAWPLATKAQQPAMPAIGFLSASSASAYGSRLSVFRQALKEAGFGEGENVKIDYRWADDNTERLPALASELVNEQVAVIIASSGAQTVLAARAATTKIPIIFQNGSDPVKLGLVASLSRPGSNVTGITSLVVETAAKRLELICELVPNANIVGWMNNPKNPNASALARDIEQAAGKLGRRAILVNVTNESDLDQIFARLGRQRVRALTLSADPIFFTRRQQLVELTARYSIPTMFGLREFVDAGGLASYAANTADAYRQVALYTARILKGEKPAELPVVQSSKYEMVLNLKTAKALRLNIPTKILALADEVIE